MTITDWDKASENYRRTAVAVEEVFPERYKTNPLLCCGRHASDGATFWMDSWIELNFEASTNDDDVPEPCGAGEGMFCSRHRSRLWWFAGCKSMQLLGCFVVWSTGVAVNSFSSGEGSMCVSESN